MCNFNGQRVVVVPLRSVPEGKNGGKNSWSIEGLAALGPRRQGLRGDNAGMVPWRLELRPPLSRPAAGPILRGRYGAVRSVSCGNSKGARGTLLLILLEKFPGAVFRVLVEKMLKAGFLGMLGGGENCYEKSLIFEIFECNEC